MDKQIIQDTLVNSLAVMAVKRLRQEMGQAPEARALLSVGEQIQLKPVLGMDDHHEPLLQAMALYSSYHTQRVYELDRLLSEIKGTADPDLDQFIAKIPDWAVDPIKLIIRQLVNEMTDRKEKS